MLPLGPIESDGSFQGLLLVAHPSLKDPNFRRSVLLLSAHAATAGAFGLILNRPLGKMAAELLPKHNRQDVLERVPVYLGGPVAHDQLSFADVHWDAGNAAMRLDHNLSLDEVADRTEGDLAGVRAFVGYSGWAAGQLEGELLQKSWVLIKPQEKTVVPEPDERCWYRIMNALGPTYKLLAALPDDPSLN